MKELRRKKLSDLLNGPRFNGDRSAFCAQAGITNSRLSQLLDPNESFGDVAANNLIESLRLGQDFFVRDDTSLGKGLPSKNNEIAKTDDLRKLANVKNNVSLSRAAIELAMLFDMIPEESRINRAKAFSSACEAIVAVLEDRNISLPAPDPKKQPHEHP